MGEFRAGKSLRDSLFDGSTVPSQNPDLTVFVDDFKVVAPEFD